MPLVVHEHRVYIQGRHVHHGATGVALALLGLALSGPLGAALFGIGATLMYHDWPDRRSWLPDLLVVE